MTVAGLHNTSCQVFYILLICLLCVRSIDVVEIMDLVLGLFKISKMDEDMDKIVACVQVVFDDILADADADADENTMQGYPELNRRGRRWRDFSRRVRQQCHEEQVSHQHVDDNRVDKHLFWIFFR